MSETRALLTDAAARLFADIRTREVSAGAERGEWPAAMWRALEDVGLSEAARSEQRGGAGASFGDIAALVRVSGAHAVPIPLVETLLGEQMLAAAGLVPLAGPLSVAPVIGADRLHLARRAGTWSLSGSLHRVPWGRDAAAVICIAEAGGEAVTVVLESPVIERRARNYAHEPRDDVCLVGLELPAQAVGQPGVGWDGEALRFRGALFRSLQMAGALERVLAMTIAYAQERVAFGRPIGKFQAVQQQIAVLATEVAAASAATQAAVDAVGGSGERFATGAAKARVGEAAGKAAAIAHQVHAAIGFTHEHALHLSTRRLWSWRDEFGSEADWCVWVGEQAAKVGGESLWAFLTASASAGGGV